MRLGLGIGLGFHRSAAKRDEEMPIKYLFIDGGCLRATLKKTSERYFGARPIAIDYVRLKSDHNKVFYYDAIPAIKANESQKAYEERIRPRIELHNHLATLPGFHIYEGDSRIRRKQVQQKEVDVMIAVDMLTHTFRSNMNRATFIASDLDFKPLLDALVREGMFVELWYPPSDTSQDLINSADERNPLAIDKIHGFLDRDSQEALEMPERGLYTKRDFDERQSLSVYQHPSLGQIKYRFFNGKHEVYWNDTMNINHFMVTGTDQYPILQKYVEDVFLVTLPPAPPEHSRN